MAGNGHDHDNGPACPGRLVTARGVGTHLACSATVMAVTASNFVSISSSDMAMVGVVSDGGEGK